MKNLWKMAVVGAVSALTAATAQAGNFVNTTTGNIGNNTACAGAPTFGATLTTANLVRSFTVSGEPNVVDLDVGFIASHTWRGDIRFILRPPSGAANQVTLIVDDTSADGNIDNYNIRLSDQATPPVNTGSHAVGNNTATAPYQFTVRPTNANVLSSFNGINPNGTWQMIFCDNAGTEQGQFLRGELIFAAPEADLSLSLASSNPAPERYSSVNLTTTLQNAGPGAATATVNVNLPAGLSYISHSGPGTFDPATGLWTPPTGLASGANAQLVINALVEATGSYTTTAEVTSSNLDDPDSTPGNLSTNEDDDDSLTLSPVTPTQTTNLTCPASDRFALNWADRNATTGNAWPAGALTPPTYTVNGEDLDFTVSGATARLINRTYGGATFATPASEDQFANGSTDFGVLQNVRMVNTTETLLTTLAVGTAGVGVGQLEFQIRDVDNGTDGNGNQWVDRIAVAGSFDGTSVAPTITTGPSNSATGSTILGTGGSATGSSNGNVLISFTSPVDEVSFSYGNSATTATLASQIISLQRIVMCPRNQADLSAIKTVEVNDPGNLGLYMTPGNEVLYKIIATNAATATADAEDVDIQDTLPPNLKFISASTTGFTGGAFGSPALPATNQDCGATPCVIRFSGAEVPIGSTGEVIVIAEIK